MDGLGSHTIMFNVQCLQLLGKTVVPRLGPHQTGLRFFNPALKYGQCLVFGHL